MQTLIKNLIKLFIPFLILGTFKGRSQDFYLINQKVTLIWTKPTSYIDGTLIAGNTPIVYDMLITDYTNTLSILIQKNNINSTRLNLRAIIGNRLKTGNYYSIYLRSVIPNRVSGEWTNAVNFQFTNVFVAPVSPSNMKLIQN